MELKVGVLTLQSGAVPQLSRSFLNGLKLAFEGKDVEPKFLVEGIGLGIDTGMMVDKVEKLIAQEDVDVIVGMVGHREIARLYSTAEAMEVPLLYSDLGATLPIDLKPNGWTFTLSTDLWHSAYLIGKMMGEQGLKDVGVSSCYYDCSYGILEALERGLYQAGGSFAGHYIVPHTPRENESECLTEAVKHLQPSKFFTVHSGLYAKEYADILQGSEEAQKVPMYATVDTVPSELLETKGALYRGAKILTTWAKELDTPGNKKFAADLMEEKGKEPDVYSMLGYETGLVLTAALASFKPGSKVKPHSLAKAIAEVDIEGPRGRLAFDPEIRRSLNDHTMFEVVEEDGEYYYKVSETIPTDRDVYVAMINEAYSAKRGGWFNAYLCT